MCVYTAFHVVCSGFLVLLISTGVARSSSYMRAYGAKELWPYFRIRCDLNCPYGYETDIEGNFVCLCHDPCQNVLCFGRTRCVVQLPKRCSRDYCRPHAMCKDMGPFLPSRPFPHGLFLADDATTSSADTSVPERCQLPVKDAAKHCRKMRTRWFYDDVTGSCKAFWGCKTKGNNFRGRRGCEKTCITLTESKKKHRNYAPGEADDVKLTPQDHSSFQPSPICSQTPRAVVTSCKRLSRRWFFNSESGTCQKFWSCPESGNNFSRKKHCKNLCIESKTSRRKGRRNASHPANQ